MFKEYLSIKDKKVKEKIDYRDIFYVFLGGLLAYIFNIYLGQGAIIAASLVGILGFGFKPKYSIQLYTGAFVGMVSPEVYHDFYHIILASIIAGIIFALGKNIFDGFGGKLGATAFSSWIIIYYMCNIDLLSLDFTLENNYYLLIITFLGTLLTFLFSHYYNKNVVAVSAIISLIGALILPEIMSNYDVDYSLVLMTATFAGMSSKDRVKSILEMLIISLFVAIIFIYSYSHFGGGGGKLGTIAFGAVLSSYGLKSIYKKIKNAHI
ncbi:MAG: hypothetical protein ACQESN_06380 [Thermotogota bacterium]